MANGKDLMVVGAGVIGLTAAVRLLEAGHRVRVVAERFSPDTTSDVAAAVWMPYKAYPPERVLAWAETSYRVYADLAEAGVPGVRFGDVVLHYPDPNPQPFWLAAVPHVERRPAPPPFAETLTTRVPFVESPRFMPWLRAHVERLGGTLERRRVTALAACLTDADVVVNATGLGARTLADDDTLYPIRGQIARLERPAGDLPCVCVDDGPLAPVYVIPRTDDVVCGGTAQPHADALAPDANDAATILQHCRTLVPALADARLIEHRVGLRPGRPTVRLEPEATPDGPIVHTYGHGGSGYTLCWGCADEVASLVSGL